MFITMPGTFPESKFIQFGQLSVKFFPRVGSDEYLSDPLQKRQHSDRAWMAVAYRYRSCAEANDEFKLLLSGASELAREWNSDEEHNFKLSACVYSFYTNCLSVFESLAYSLYFLGGSIQPADFPHIGKPTKITLEQTGEAFSKGFPSTALASRLRALPDVAEYKRIALIRNILAHRLTGRPSSTIDGTIEADGTSTYVREDKWFVLGVQDQPSLDHHLLQQPLDAITKLLEGVLDAAIEFAR